MGNGTCGNLWSSPCIRDEQSKGSEEARFRGYFARKTKYITSEWPLHRQSRNIQVQWNTYQFFYQPGNYYNGGVYESEGEALHYCATTPPLLSVGCGGRCCFNVEKRDIQSGDITAMTGPSLLSSLPLWLPCILWVGGCWLFVVCAR